MPARKPVTMKVWPSGKWLPEAALASSLLRAGTVTLWALLSEPGCIALLGCVHSGCPACLAGCF